MSSEEYGLGRPQNTSPLIYLLAINDPRYIRITE